jgi:hypothetical protein
VRLTETAYLQEVRAATRRKGHSKGWADSQPLAVRVVQGNDTVLRYGPGAKIVPHDDLENLRERDFERDRQVVAYIYIDTAYPKLLIPAPPSRPQGVFEVLVRSTQKHDSLGRQMKIRHPWWASSRTP